MAFGDTRHQRRKLPYILRSLRHLYEQMLSGHVVDTKQAAVGLLGPAIEKLEELDRDESWSRSFAEDALDG